VVKRQAGKQMSTIVVIDDDRSTTSLIKMLLEMEGYNVAASTTVAAAMADPHEDAVAMIVDCYLTKNESGIDFLHAVRQGKTDFRADIPAILVSGDQRLEEEAKEAGATLFMLKPYSPNELAAQIKMLVAPPG
jgi:DNA-binding response OmpR family regulator